MEHNNKLNFWTSYIAVVLLFILASLAFINGTEYSDGQMLIFVVGYVFVFSVMNDYKPSKKKPKQ
jgi:hypothetical protein